MTKEMVREKVHFASGGDDCAAWHYRGTNGACVVMAGGFAVTKEAGTDAFAARFRRAGFSVLAFDYRRLGESGGQPRLVLPVRDQLADWQAAITFAATLPDVDAAKIALWAFSASGGHVLRVAAGNPAVAAVIAQTPNTDGLAAARNQARHQRVGAMLRFSGRGALDAAGGAVGRPPRLVPLAGAPGTVAVLTTPDAQDGGLALDPDHRYPDWQQQVAARSALRLGWYSRAGPHAGCAARCWCWSAIRTSPRSPGRPCGPPSERRKVSWCACPAAITTRSWPATRHRSRPSSASCAATCCPRAANRPLRLRP